MKNILVQVGSSKHEGSLPKSGKKTILKKDFNSSKLPVLVLSGLK